MSASRGFMMFETVKRSSSGPMYLSPAISFRRCFNFRASSSLFPADSLSSVPLTLYLMQKREPLR